MWLGPLVVILTVVLQAPGGALAQVFNPETFTLKNGLQVVVIANHRVPIVSHMIWYKVGAADEVPGKTGIAHMVEHMMFKGTRTVPAGQFSATVARNGGQENAFTSSDQTAYFQNVARDKLELVMTLEADRMANFAPKDADFQLERQVVIEERRMRTENEPESLLDEQAMAALFLVSPYHHPVIGWHQDIDGYTLADVMAFQRTWYAPNNAILIVAGDITAAQLKPLAERIYGRIPARPVPLRHRPPEAPAIAERRLEIRAEAVQQPVWTRLYLAPSYHSLPEVAAPSDGAPPSDGAHAEAAKPEAPTADVVATASALEVLSQILGGGATSRLYRALVVDHKVASTVSVAYDPDYLGQTDFSISLSPLPDVSMESLEQAILTQLRALAADGVTDDEVARAKKRLQAQVTYARDSLHTGARVIGQSLTSGGSVGLVEGWPARIAAVSREQVDAALHRVLRDERSVTARLLPATADTQTLVVDPAAAAGMAGGRGLR